MSSYLASRLHKHAGTYATIVPAFVRQALIPSTYAGRRLALIALIDSLGTGLFLTGAALYFTRFLGLQPDQISWGLSLAGIIGLLGTLPSGMLADRFGPGRIYVALQAWRGFGYLAYGLIDSFPAFLIVAACIGLVDGAIPAINQAVVGTAVSSKERVDTLAKIRAVRNVGFSAGAILATLAISLGSREAFLLLVLGNAASFFIVAIMLVRTGLARGATTWVLPRRQTGFSLDLRFGAAAFLNGILSVHLTLLTIGLPLWIAEHTNVPVVMIGVLITINSVMAATLQARFAAPAAEIPGAVACAQRAGLALATCGLLALVMSQVSLAWLGILLAVAAVVAMTCGELWQSAGGWTISFELAPPERQAQYLATFQLGTSLQTILGPWMIIELVFPSHFGWLGFAVTTVLAGVLMRVAVGRDTCALRAGAAQPVPPPC